MRSFPSTYLKRKFLGAVLNNSLNVRHFQSIPAVRPLDTAGWEGATAWGSPRSAASAPVSGSASARRERRIPAFPARRARSGSS